MNAESQFPAPEHGSGNGAAVPSAEPVPAPIPVVVVESAGASMPSAEQVAAGVAEHLKGLVEESGDTTASGVRGDVRIPVAIWLLCNDSRVESIEQRHRAIRQVLFTNALLRRRGVPVRLVIDDPADIIDVRTRASDVESLLPELYSWGAIDEMIGFTDELKKLDDEGADNVSRCFIPRKLHLFFVENIAGESDEDWGDGTVGTNMDETMALIAIGNGALDDIPVHELGHLCGLVEHANKFRGLDARNFMWESGPLRRFISWGQRSLMRSSTASLLNTSFLHDSQHDEENDLGEIDHPEKPVQHRAPHRDCCYVRRNRTTDGDPAEALAAESDPSPLHPVVAEDVDASPGETELVAESGTEEDSDGLDGISRECFEAVLRERHELFAAELDKLMSESPGWLTDADADELRRVADDFDGYRQTEMTRYRRGMEIRKGANVVPKPNND